MGTLVAANPRRRTIPTGGSPARGTDPAPLDTLESAFALLSCEPYPLAVDGARLGLGLPARMIPVPELRQILLLPETPGVVRDAVWRELVLAARKDGPAWVVAAVGTALPGLRARARRLALGFRGDVRDLEAEMLSACVAAVHGLDLDRPRVAMRLCAAAYNAGRRLVRREARQPRAVGLLVETPAMEAQDPEEVLGRAVALGVITGADAELISETRLGGVAMSHLAQASGRSHSALCNRRRRAELAVARAVAEGRLGDE